VSEARIMTEPDFQAEILKASQSVGAALIHVHETAGPERAALTASLMVRIAVGFALERFGSDAAKYLLTWGDLQDAIAVSEPPATITPSAII
jgi:hypothetical protein